MNLPSMARWAAVALLYATRTTAAESPAPPPSELPRLIVEALERSADVVEANEQAGAARQRVRPAAALPDPMFSVSYENDGSQPSLGTQEMTRLAFMGQQALPFPGKQKLAGQIASVEADEVSTRVSRARLSVEAGVRRAYADLLLARENLGLVKEQIGAWSDIDELTRVRYAAGMGSLQDILRTQSERTRLEQLKVRDEAAELVALTDLSRLLQRRIEASEIVGGRLTRAALTPPPSREEAVQLAEEVSPELAQVRLAKERARLSANLARRNLRPDFLASAAYMNRGGLPLMWSVGVGVTVPLWAGQKQAPLIAEAEGGMRAAAAAEVSLHARLRMRTEERIIRLGQLAREAALDSDVVLVQDQLSVDAALANYRTGSLPFVSVLEALSTLFGDRRAAVSRLAAYLKTQADFREFSLDGESTGSAMASSSAPVSTPSTSGM